MKAFSYTVIGKGGRFDDRGQIADATNTLAEACKVARFIAPVVTYADIYRRGEGRVYRRYRVLDGKVKMVYG